MKAFASQNLTCSYKTRKYLKEYGKMSTMHGIYYLTEQRSRTEKLFWITIMSLCLSGCIFLILEMWKKYETSPIVVSFASRESFLHEIPFPAVTICPEAKCAKSKLNQMGINKTFWGKNKFLNKKKRALKYVQLLCAKEDESDDSGIRSKVTLIQDDFFDVIEEVTPNLQIKCSFFGKNFECAERYTRVMTDQGICYSFNMLDRSEIFRNNVIHFKNFSHVFYNSSFFDKESGYLDDAPFDAYPVRAYLAGADNALEIYFAHNVSDTECECNTFLQGFRVLLHGSLDIPQLTKHYFRVSYDKAVMVAVQPHLVMTKDKVKKIDSEKRRCYLKNERRLKYFRSYSQKNCFLECFTNFTLRKCGCVNFFMPRENNTRICNGKLMCLDHAEREMKRAIIGLNQKMCDCRPSCSFLRYDVETSQGDFYWQGYIHKNKNEMVHDEEMRYSFLSVYFKTDHFMTLERKEMYGISDFISNFGGLLSLFTGFSLISLFEIIYFLSLRILCNKQMYKNWAGSVC